MSPSDLARLQSARAAAHAWLDHCDVDLMEAEQRISRLRAEQAQAREALHALDVELEKAWRVKG